jgi:hypothetical protein
MALALFLVALATRIPFRSQFAYHWDSAQFALAVGEYNIRIGQPHAPGFWLYVMLGRAVNQLVGEPHAALVWLSVVAGAWLAAVGYLLAASMFGRRSGLGTGVILLTSPLCWFHSEVALTTIVDSALIVSFVFVCWRAIHRRVTWFQTITLAALLAVVGGVRQQSAPLLIPLWAYVFWGFARPRAWKFLCAVALAVCFSLFWLVPTMKSAGGLVPYLYLLHLKNHYHAPQSVWGGGGFDVLMKNIFWIGATCWAGLLGAAVIAVLRFSLWVFFKDPESKNDFYRANKHQLCLLALWATPMALFWMLMYVTMPGYVLNFFPALAVLAGLGLAGSSERVAASSAVGTRWALGGILTIVAVGNVVAFSYSSPALSRLLLGLPLTGVEIREHDVNLSACIQTIRKNWPTRNVVIFHKYEDFYWGFRQFQYYLPEYENVLLATDASLPGVLGAKKWIGYERQTTFQSEVPIPVGQDVLLVVPPGQSLDLFKACFDVRKAVLVIEAGAKLYQLHQ